jgi:hypothetical protein
MAQDNTLENFSDRGKYLILAKIVSICIGFLLIYSLGNFVFATIPVKAQSVPGASARVFAPDSFWYKPLPRIAPLHPDSAKFVEEFLRQKRLYYGTVSINTVKYASPVYVASELTPRVVVRPWDCTNRGYIDRGLSEQWRDVPLPAYAEPADGTDAEMTIYSPAADAIWEFWRARKVGDVWEACWGGRMNKASASSGIWPFPYGATATGLPFLGGQLSIEELRNKKIDHVMGISLVETENWSIVSWPANRSDGANPQKERHRIPEGLRFRLDPAVDVEGLTMHPLGKAIARAAQLYGFVVWDKAGAITLRAENPKSVTTRQLPDPFVAIFEGRHAYQILEGFPWERIQFLPMDFGRP